MWGHTMRGFTVVALIDMDCFYCQVEARLNPDLKGVPSAVGLKNFGRFIKLSSQVVQVWEKDIDEPDTYAMHII